MKKIWLLLMLILFTFSALPIHAQNQAPKLNDYDYALAQGRDSWVAFEYGSQPFIDYIQWFNKVIYLYLEEDLRGTGVSVEEFLSNPNTFFRNEQNEDRKINLGFDLAQSELSIACYQAMQSGKFKAGDIFWVKAPELGRYDSKMYWDLEIYSSNTEEGYLKSELLRLRNLPIDTLKDSLVVVLGIPGKNWCIVTTSLPLLVVIPPKVVYKPLYVVKALVQEDPVNGFKNDAVVLKLQLLKMADDGVDILVSPITEKSIVRSVDGATSLVIGTTGLAIDTAETVVKIPLRILRWTWQKVTSH